MIILNLEPYKGIAGIYEEVRPSYPEQLINDIISFTKLNRDDRVLEIGAGTGKATIQFASKGYQIRAVEIGEDMAHILSDKCLAYSNVTIDVASFEEWIYKEDQKFDIIFSAQAFHWIDKEIKYQKCYELLKEKGYLVLFWYEPCGYNNPVSIDIKEQVDQVVKKYTANYYANTEKTQRFKHTGVSSKDERKNEIETTSLFHIIKELDYTYSIKNNSSQYLKAMKSVPAYASVLDGLEASIVKEMDKEIQDIIDNNGGSVEEEFQYSLFIAQKK